MSKKYQVLDYLKIAKSITSWEAITKFRATRLSDIIFRLQKEGHVFLHERCHEKNADGTTSHYTRYIYCGEKNG